jgi:hypothetical protein
MRNPFLRRVPVLPGEQAYPNSPLKTPKREFIESETLQLILHIPANGFVQLQPPLNTSSHGEIPGKYDHILQGEIELFGPPAFADYCQRIKVGVRLSSRLVFAEDKVEENIIFDRSVDLSDGLKLVPGAQRYVSYPDLANV